MTFSTTTPILRIFDVTKAREHYLDFLGFKQDWEHRYGDNFPLYFQVSKDGCLLHLSEHFGDACPGAAVRIQVTGLKDYHAGLLAKTYRHSRPGLETQPWGTHEVTVPDPFGNKLIFWETIEPAAEA